MTNTTGPCGNCGKRFYNDQEFDNHSCMTPAPRPDDKEEPLLQLFRYDHLPPHLQILSRPFCELAHEVVRMLEPNCDRTTCLRRLREAKDCAITARLWIEREWRK